MAADKTPKKADPGKKKGNDPVIQIAKALGKVANEGDEDAVNAIVDQLPRNSKGESFLPD
jgi:hypothetical protein